MNLPCRFYWSIIPPRRKNPRQRKGVLRAVVSLLTVLALVTGTFSCPLFFQPADRVAAAASPQISSHRYDDSVANLPGGLAQNASRLPPPRLAGCCSHQGDKCICGCCARLAPAHRKPCCKVDARSGSAMEPAGMPSNSGTSASVAKMSTTRDVPQPVLVACPCGGPVRDVAVSPTNFEFVVPESLVVMTDRWVGQSTPASLYVPGNAARPELPPPRRPDC